MDNYLMKSTNIAEASSKVSVALLRLLLRLYQQRIPKIRFSEWSGV